MTDRPWARLVVPLGIVLGVAVATPFAVAERVDTGTLALQADFTVAYPSASCPAGTPSRAECFIRTGTAVVRGLGSVEASYPYLVDADPPGCAANQIRTLPTRGRLSVQGKGTIEVRIDGSGCLDRIPPSPVSGTEAFTITGGSDRYAGASGAGTLSTVSNGPPAWRGRDVWSGTLVVPGLAFDLTPPVLTVPRSKTMRVPRGVKRVRVTYAVSASDDVDATVPVACKPRSGATFPLGGTRVGCGAADTSGNASTASFVVTVTRRR